MNVVVNGLMTNYEKVGKGKTVICLHGWGDNSKTFSELAQQLQDKYEVLILDLPGIGHSEGPSEAWGLNDYAKFIQSWLNKIGVEDPYGVIGHSNGGAIAMRGVAGKFFKPEKLVLLASAGIRNNRKLKRKLLKVVSKTGKIITSPLPKNTKHKIRSRFYRKIGSDIGLFPHMEGTFRKIITEDTQNDASQINIPTLLIYGDKDKSTPVSYGRTFHNLIKNSQLKIIDTGHFLHHEQPEVIGRLVKEFLDA